METDSLPTAETKPPKLRWYQPTPGRLVIVLLAVEGILLLSERWFPKGWAVLIAIASVGVAMVLMFLWFVLALCSRLQFQFSIRSLLVLTVVVAVPFSWLAVEMKGAREQREAVEAIQKLGGDVYYDYQQSNTTNPNIPNPGPPEPIWLRTLLGGDFFTNVTDVGLKDTQVTDADLKHLKGLAHLESLSLDSTQVMDAGLEHLKGLTHLQYLSLDGTQVTDAGLEHLKGLTKLQQLSLGGTHVTVEGVKGLQAALPKCDINTKLFDTGFEHLKRMPQLQLLCLNNTHVTDKGVKKLQQALPDCAIHR